MLLHIFCEHRDIWQISVFNNKVAMRLVGTMLIRLVLQGNNCRLIHRSKAYEAAVSVLLTDTSIVQSEHQRIPKEIWDDTQTEDAARMCRAMLALKGDANIEAYIRRSDHTIAGLCLVEYTTRVRGIKPSGFVDATRKIFIPLADRHKFLDIRDELGDMCCEMTDPDSYAAAASYLERTRARHRRLMAATVAEIYQLCDREYIDSQIYCRLKARHSLVAKQKKCRLHRPHSVLDVAAVRVVVSRVDDCYRIARHVSSMWTICRTKDFIAVPKPNGYRAIHCTILRDGSCVELQLRTRTMDVDAEHGDAAHWLYKRESAAATLETKQNRHASIIDT